MSEESVLFRVTRPNTSVFHPDRSTSLKPVMTGGEIELPKKVAEYHVKNGVGVIVDPNAEPEKATEPEKAPESSQEPEKKAEEPKAPARRPGRPAKASE